MRSLTLILTLALLTTGLASASAPRSTSALDILHAATGASALPDIPEATLREAILAHYALVGAIPTAAGLAALDTDLATIPDEIAQPAADLLAAMNEAARLRAEAFSQVSVEDARFAWDTTLRASPPTENERARLEGILARIDVETMMLAGALVVGATDAARTELAAAGPVFGVNFVDPLGSIEIADAADHTHAANRTLLIDLGGNDDWQNNAGASMPDFIIQAFPGCITTGGLDCTPLHPSRNSNALESVFGRTCSFDATQAPFVGQAYLADADEHVQDQQEQQSVPAAQRFVTQTTTARANELAASPSPDTRCLPTGADDAQAWSNDFVTKGIIGDGDEHVVAVALDLGGDDRFAPLREFNDINDGDNAADCDTRGMGDAGRLWNRNLTAGGAFAGIGVLWDTNGNDFYGGRSLTQGVGHMAAVGVLVDQGAGSDVYSGVRLAQGAGIFAALGLLYDESGDDRYRLENDVPFFNEFEHFIGCDVSTRDGQGRANFNGIGILADLAGNDDYFVQAHDASVPGASRDDANTTQGSTGTRLNIGPSPVNGAAALGVGLLWDRSGDDRYTRPGRTNEMTDASGVFVDGDVMIAPSAACDSGPAETRNLQNALCSALSSVGEIDPPAGDALMIACAAAPGGVPQEPCRALHGDAGIGGQRFCGATPPPQAQGLPALLAWHAISTFDDQRLDRPNITIVPRLPLLTPVNDLERNTYNNVPASTPLPIPDTGIKVCSNHHDRLNETL